MLTPLSSPVDWCEPNYVHNSLIAEFFNTISNLPIIFLPVIGIRLNRDYFDHVTSGAKWIYYCFTFVGLFSAYYHATLSLVGQLLDELGILWVITISFVVYLPGMLYLPRVCKKHIKETTAGILILASIISVLSFIKPSVNSYLLMILSVPIFARFFKELQLVNDNKANDLCLVTVALWGGSVSVWMSDRAMCNVWQTIGFPYFHAIWHLVSAFACYYAMILCSYLDALAHASHLRPVVRYAPQGFPLGIPYVGLNAKYKSLDPP